MIYCVFFLKKNLLSNILDCVNEFFFINAFLLVLCFLFMQYLYKKNVRNGAKIGQHIHYDSVIMIYAEL
jgi:hypothetical protein